MTPKILLEKTAFWNLHKKTPFQHILTDDLRKGVLVNGFEKGCRDATSLKVQKSTFWKMLVCIPRTQMTLVLIGKGLVLGGLTFKNRGELGSRYI